MYYITMLIALLSVTCRNCSGNAKFNTTNINLVIKHFGDGIV